jgi:hypothetical protein
MQCPIGRPHLVPLAELDERALIWFRWRNWTDLPQSDFPWILEALAADTAHCA